MCRNESINISGAFLYIDIGICIRCVRVSDKGTL
nr:MAG TPA: hypothetical protein [Caudoviricetes sp.]